MDLMSPLGLGVLALAAIAAGIINTVVGSGTLITFPALLALGVPPVTANMANTVGLAIGNIGGVIGYRRELRGLFAAIVPLAVLTAIGALIGALALLVLPPDVFRIVAPVLVIVGCVLVGIQPLLRRRATRTPGRTSAPAWLRFPLTAATGVYGGYFGAAQGVLIVGVLEMTMTQDIQRINAIKNVLQTLAGGVATVVFVFAASLPWVAIATLALGSLAGAVIGAAIGRRLPAWLLRTLIIVIGVVAVYFLVI
ncbi:sulfite exporter TauE/SafE family protein [Microbacterium sp. NPDC055357]